MQCGAPRGEVLNLFNHAKNIASFFFFRFERSDFGLDMAAPAVSDEVSLRITTEGTIADAVAPAADAPAAADAASQG